MSHKLWLERCNFFTGSASVRSLWECHFSADSATLKHINISEPDPHKQVRGDGWGQAAAVSPAREGQDVLQDRQAVDEEECDNILCETNNIYFVVIIQLD